MIRLERILHPTDFSELSLHALGYARSFAEAYAAELHVVHVVDEACQYWMAVGPSGVPVGPPLDEWVTASKVEIQRFVDANLAGVDLRIQAQVLVGRPFMEIIRYARAQQVDLIVLGTHGRSGLRNALLGSVAERVVRKSPCPVLTIRHPEHDFVMP